MNALQYAGLAAAVLIGAPGLALAQDQSSSAMDSTASTSATAPAMAPATPSTTVTADQNPSQAAALAAGDNKTVTNGPVPDTPSNRAKYGKPMSHAGKQTAPAGN